MKKTHKFSNKGRINATPTNIFDFLFSIFCIVAIVTIQGCAVLDAGVKTVELTTKAVGATGKLAVGTIKTTAGVVKAAGDLAVKTGEAASKVQHTASKAADIVGPARIVKLYKVGNSMYSDVVINKRVKARLLLDTGATDMQISSRIAKQIGIRSNEGDLVPVTLAGGRQAAARSVILKEVKVGPMRVKNVRALILEGDLNMDDDGLLGMSYLNNFVFKIDAENAELSLKRTAN